MLTAVVPQFRVTFSQLPVPVMVVTLAQAPQNLCIPSPAALLHASVPAVTTVPLGTVTDSSIIHEVSVTSQTLAYSKTSTVTIKPERLLEPLIERSLAGGRSLTLLARHHFGSF
jgi:hypothetical protein